MHKAYGICILGVDVCMFVYTTYTHMQGSISNVRGSRAHVVRMGRPVFSILLSLSVNVRMNVLQNDDDDDEDDHDDD